MIDSDKKPDDTSFGKGDASRGASPSARADASNPSDDWKNGSSPEDRFSASDVGGLLHTGPLSLISSSLRAIPDLRTDNYLEDSSRISALPLPANKLAGNTVIAILARFMTYGVSLPLSIITARLLGPHDKGVYTLILLVITVFSYCTFGISSAGIYYVGRKLYTHREVVANLMTLGLLISALMTALYVILAFVAPIPVFSSIPPTLLVLLGILSPVTLFSAYLSDAQLAVNDIVGYNIGNILQVVIQAAGLAAFILLFHNALAAATYAYTLGAILSLVCIVALLLKRTRITIGWNPRLIREMFQFGFRSYLTAILNLGNLRLDTFLVSIFVSVTALGYYSVATSLSEMLWQLPLVMGSILFPAMASLSSAGGAKVSATICRRMVFVIIVSAAALLVVSRFLLTLFFGHSYIPSLIPLWLLLPGAVGFTIYKTLYSYLLGNGKPSIGIVSAGVSLLVTIGLDITLIPRLGINGAAITSSIAYCLNGVIILGAFLKYGRVSLAETLILRPSDLGEMVLRTRQIYSRLAQRRSQGAFVGRRVGTLIGRVNGWSERRRMAVVCAGCGLLAGLWLVTLIFHLSAVLLVLCFIGLFAALAIVNRLWLVTALLVADVTLTDYTISGPFSFSLRTILGLLVIYALLLTLAQRRFEVGLDALRLRLPLLLFFGVATISNLLNGGDTVVFLRHSFAGVAVLITIAATVRRKRDVFVIVAPALLVAFLSAATALLQAYTHNTTTLASNATLKLVHGRGVGLTQSPITLANGLAVFTALLGGIVLYAPLSRNARIIGWWGVFLLALGVYSSGSRSGVLALGVIAATLVVALRTRARWLLLALVIALDVAAAVTLSGVHVGSHFTVIASPSATTKTFTTHTLTYTPVKAALSPSATATPSTVTLGARMPVATPTPSSRPATVVLNRSAGDTEISTGTREVLWEAAFYIIRDHPLLGIGYDRFEVVSVAYRGHISRSLLAQRGVGSALGNYPPHNDFLTMWLSFGIFGFLAFLWLHVFGAWSAWQTWKRARDPWIRAMALGCLAALGAYCVHELVHNAYDDTLLLWALLGLIVALDKLRRLGEAARPRAQARAAHERGRIPAMESQTQQR